ncbi:MAG: DUF4428 domain-containing protein [Butyricicoccus pullicaecorum]|nr:DUF4428 domain-containing protein [Butyricicoccus pullicaecorum]
MGLLKKKATCSICGDKISTFGGGHQISDGMICPLCQRIASKSVLASASEIRAAWNENSHRLDMFTQTMTFPAASSHSVFIDATHQYFYISSAKIKNTLSETRQPVVVRFDEVMAYSSQIVGQKTVTKKKGSLGRAVVGGALFGVAGAVIGAGTAKQETKSTGGISTIRIDACVNGLNTEFLLANPTMQFCRFLDEITD